MKIGVEIQPILKDKTGVGWYTQKILKNFYNNDFNFEGYGFNFINRNNIKDSLENINFNIKINKLIPYSIYRRVWAYIPLTYNSLFNSKADIYHFFNYIVPPRIKGKVIVTVYDMVYKLHPETMDKRNFNRLDKELKRSVEKADKIITISKNSKKEIIKFLDVSEEKVEIVHPGIDIKLYNRDFNREEINKVREKYKLPEKYILYLGTLEPRKNISTIIKAYQNLLKKYDTNIYLVIAGKKGWMYKEIFKKVKDYGIEKKVIFTGYVDEEDKPLIYKMSKAFVFPSLYEGFGMPVLEAMSAGVPVITSNTSALPEVVGNAGLLVNPKSTKELTNAIIKVIEDRNSRNKMVQEGIRQSKKFSWKRSAEKLLQVYREVGDYEKSTYKWSVNR
ncbi:glycosyltransferase family 4 protein [Thermohalobacter berrensis]|uniref:Group 1 glycosyl transferase n=1 Tax=Thermohalobacter berrensis TaxID=99594 RepID=A0A419T4A5_9FIRM|nr:glycosyltransferase family 1 protein [Thermohalobacter berrensis]RKD32279.1 group 1 glycosyl transferase [Thermohalobacter berrensis]